MPLQQVISESLIDLRVSQLARFQCGWVVPSATNNDSTRALGGGEAMSASPMASTRSSALTVRQQPLQGRRQRQGRRQQPCLHATQSDDPLLPQDRHASSCGSDQQSVQLTRRVLLSLAAAAAAVGTAPLPAAASKLPEAIDRAWEGLGGGPADLLFPGPWVHGGLVRVQGRTAEWAAGFATQPARPAVLVQHKGALNGRQAGRQAPAAKMMCWPQLQLLIAFLPCYTAASCPLCPRCGLLGCCADQLSASSCCLPHPTNQPPFRAESFLGVWDVESVLTSVETPLGPEFVPDMRVGGEDACGTMCWVGWRDGGPS